VSLPLNYNILGVEVGFMNEIFIIDIYLEN